MSHEVTIGEAIDAVLEHVGDRTHKISVQNGLKSPGVYRLLLGYRAQAYRQKKERRIMLNKNMVQTIEKLKLEPTVMPDDNERCQFLQSAFDLPIVLEHTNLVTPNGRRHYSFIDWEKLHYKLTSYQAFNQSVNRYGLRTVNEGMKVLIYDSMGYRLPRNESGKVIEPAQGEAYNILLEGISFPGIFYDPLAVQTRDWYTGEYKLCKEWRDYSFFTDPELLPLIYEQTVNYIKGSMNGVPPDQKQNAADDTTETPPRK